MIRHFVIDRELRFASERIQVEPAIGTERLEDTKIALGLDSMAPERRIGRLADGSSRIG